jgi:hypothetical protein
MKKLISLLLISFAATSVYAADDCASRAADLKLAGAAKNSFMKKCSADAMAPTENAACAATAKEKKLAGAAKNSYMNKCSADAMAPAATK